MYVDHLKNVSKEEKEYYTCRLKEAIEIANKLGQSNSEKIMLVVFDKITLPIKELRPLIEAGKRNY